MNNLDNRISNPDQLLTTDVERFCTSITELYSNISKPMLDIVIYVQRLAVTIGGQVSYDGCCCIGEPMKHAATLLQSQRGFEVVAIV